jgi:hypothetical protein
MPVRHPRQPARLALAAASLAALLAACGGDPDQPVPPPSSGTVPVITTQPQDLALAEGAAGTMSVLATSDAGALAYQWFDVTRNADIVGASAADLDLGPVSLGADSTRYNVRLTNTMGTTTSSNGTLTVSERAWSAPADAMASGTREFTTIVDSNGHTHLLAITGNNGAAGVEARIQLRSNDSTQANGFTSPGNVVLQPSESLSVQTTSIGAAANGAGHVLAVWHRNGIVGGALYTPDPDTANAGTWTLLPTRINSFVATSALDPAVAAVGNTSFEIVWRERVANSGAHDVVARTYTINGNTLGSPVFVEAESTETEPPRIVADAAGNVLAAWRHVGVGTVVNRRLAGENWGTTLTTVDSSAQPLEVLRTNRNGKAVLLTSNRLGIVLASRLDLAATNVVLAAPAPVANAYGSGPDAMVDNTDRIHVFGVSCCGPNGSTRMYRWIYQGLWTSPEPVSDASTSNFLTTGLGVFSPKVSDADSENNFVVTWQDRMSAGNSPMSRVSARRFHDRLSGWRSTVVVGDSNNQTVSVTLGAPGNATLVVGAPSGQALQAASLR